MKFSIITPSFNQPDWLRLAIASVSDQVSKVRGQGTEKSKQKNESDSRLLTPDSLCVEHIIQDGGSAGAENFQFPVPLRQGYEGQGSHFQGNPDNPMPYSFHFYSEPDKGMYDAINKGFDKASGDILAYLNCDEQYLPETLVKVAAFFEKHPETDILFGDALLLDAKGRALSYRRMVKPDRWHTRLCHLSTLSCAMFLRRRVWASGLRFPVQYRMIGDAVFVEAVLSRGFTAAVLPEPLATFAFTGMNQGQSARALEETGQWRRGAGAPPAWLSLPLSLLHRLKKGMAGAYAARDLEYEIFMEGAEAGRKKFQAESLGWRWPKS